jgi:hypothetical protein
MPTAAPQSTEHRPLRSPLCPTITSSNSTPRRCTSTTLPTPAPMTPSAPHCRSYPLDACHNGAPPPPLVRFPSLRTPNQTPREPGIVLGYIPHLPVLPAHRILTAAAAVCHEPSPPLFPAKGRNARRAKITAGPQRFGPL